MIDKSNNNSQQTGPENEWAVTLGNQEIKRTTKEGDL